MKSFSNKEYYQVLGITPYVGLKEIKAAYRSLAGKYHPDVNPGNKFCEERFKEIGEAYSILSDPAKKRRYDLLKGYINNTQNDSSKNFSSVKQQAKEAYKPKPDESKQEKTGLNQEKQTEQQSHEKSFNEVFSDILDGIFKKGEQKRQESPKASKQEKTQAKAQIGEDINVDINISISEAYNGAVRKVNVLHTQICTKCKGKKIIDDIPCIMCNGKGEKSFHKKISVKIPANVKEGSKVKIVNEGNRGINGGQNGDLYLIVHVNMPSLFTFEDLNVFCDLPITVTEAALGTEINVPTIDGFVSMKIPPETQSGQKFRLVREGLFDEKQNKKGDQFVTVKIELPVNLTQEEKRMFQELASLRNFNPRENIYYEGKNTKS